MTRGLATGAALIGLSLGLSAGSATGQPAAPVALDGVFSMDGRVTVAHHVRGEHVGQRLRRSWSFKSSCGQPPCSAVALFRARGSHEIFDMVALRRTGPGSYAGHGRFWVSLYCAGKLRQHGGRAGETIDVQVLHAALVNGTWYATSIHATYRNPRRVNRTRCPGGIGHDAAAYTGTLSSPLPGPVSATR